MNHKEYIIPIGEEAQDFDEIFIGVIRKQPVLIRCRNCKHCTSYYHGEQSNLGMFTYFCAKVMGSVNAYDFCSRAERKEE